MAMSVTDFSPSLDENQFVERERLPVESALPRSLGHQLRGYQARYHHAQMSWHTSNSVGTSAHSSRASGQLHRLNKAPYCPTHRLYRAGQTLLPTADSDSNFPGPGTCVPFIRFAKEICHDQSS